jgi:hypothetical protein
MANELLRLVSAIHDNREAVLRALPADGRNEFIQAYEALAVTARDHPDTESDTMAALTALLDRYPQAREALYAADPSLRPHASPAAPPASAVPAAPAVSGAPDQSPTYPLTTATNFGAPVSGTYSMPPMTTAPWMPPAQPGAPAQPPTAARPAASGTKSSVGLQWLRELTTTALAILIVGFTLWIAAKAVGLVGDDTKTPAIKDLLTSLLGPAGVVIGYYFGRAPAEAHAADATRRADSATADRDEVRAKAQQVATDLENAERASRTTDAARDQSIPVVPLHQLQAIRDRLRAI